MTTITIDTRVTVTPHPLRVEGSGEDAVLVQLWVRSGEGSWSGCLSSREATRLAGELSEAAALAASRNAA